MTKKIRIIAKKTASSEYRNAKGFIINKSRYKPFINVCFDFDKNSEWAVYPDEIIKVV